MKTDRLAMPSCVNASSCVVCCVVIGLSWPLTGGGSSATSVSTSSTGGQQVSSNGARSGNDRHSNDHTNSAQLVNSLQQLKDVMHLSACFNSMAFDETLSGGTASSPGRSQIWFCTSGLQTQWRRQRSKVILVVALKTQAAYAVSPSK